MRLKFSITKPDSGMKTIAHGPFSPTMLNHTEQLIKGPPANYQTGHAENPKPEQPL